MWTHWATKGEREEIKNIFKMLRVIMTTTTDQGRTPLGGAETVFWLLLMLERCGPLIRREVTVEASAVSPFFTQRALLLQNTLVADTMAAGANLGQHFASLPYSTYLLAELQYSPQSHSRIFRTCVSD